MKIRSIVVAISACALVVACGGGAAGAAGAEGPKAPEGGPSGASGAATTTGGAATTPPGSLAEQEAWAKLNELMERHVKVVNDACGTNIKGSYDVASYKGKFKDGETYGVSAYARSSCENLFKPVGTLCLSSDPGKARVKAKIQTIECKYGAPAQKPNVSLSGTTLSGQFDPEAGGNAMNVAVTEWLKKSL